MSNMVVELFLITVILGEDNLKTLGALVVKDPLLDIVLIPDSSPES